MCITVSFLNFLQDRFLLGKCVLLRIFSYVHLYKCHGFFLYKYVVLLFTYFLDYFFDMDFLLSINQQLTF